MSEVLSLRQVDALQAVDLRVGWIRHGIPADNYSFGFPQENGPAMYGVADTDYAVPAALLSDMGPGDMSARERIFNQEWWGETPSNTALLSDVHSLLFQSPYVDHNPLRELQDYDLLHRIRGDASPDAIHRDPALRDGLSASLDILRNLRLDDPFLYVDGLAAVKGIHRIIADSPNEGLRKGMISLDQRNSDMAQGLGDAALELADTSHKGNTPKLAFTAGSGHKDMEEILDSYGVAYSHMIAQRPLADKLFGLRDFFGGPSKSNVRFARHLARSWFKNLRQHGHTPINETLGEIRFQI
jgi:hypothetical protein